MVRLGWTTWQGTYLIHCGPWDDGRFWHVRPRLTFALRRSVGRGWGPSSVDTRGGEPQDLVHPPTRWLGGIPCHGGSHLSLIVDPMHSAFCTITGDVLLLRMWTGQRTWGVTHRQMFGWALVPPLVPSWKSVSRWTVCGAAQRQPPRGPLWVELMVSGRYVYPSLDLLLPETRPRSALAWVSFVGGRGTFGHGNLAERASHREQEHNTGWQGSLGYGELVYAWRVMSGQPGVGARNCGTTPCGEIR